MTTQYYYNYYVNQARGSKIQIGGSIDNYNLYYRGVRFQRPHVGRGWFSNLVSRVLPVLKTIGKSAGKSVLKGILDVGEDVLEGRKLSDSLRERSQQRGKEIASSSIQTVREQIGSGPVFNLATVKKRKRASAVVKARKIPKKKSTDKVYLNFLKELKKYKQKGQRLKQQSSKRKKKKSVPTRRRPQQRQTPASKTKRGKPKKKKPTKKSTKKLVRLEGLTD
jgi:hypothetical protein